MPGLAIAAASSAAWATMGAQAETALNGGWILDQRVDAAGAFISNGTPTSSGATFQSTGDATAFYVIGRAFRAITTTGGAAQYTSVGTVGQSSFAGGITTVYINQFSTAAGLSTGLSTGSIVSVAGGPIVPLSTGFNFFGGPMPAASTGGSGVAFGTTAAGSSGLIRMSNSAIAIVGKTSTGGDDIVWPQQFQSTTLNADVASSGTNFTTIISKTLAVGTWYIAAGITISSTGTGGYAVAKITDGTNDLASAYVTNDGAGLSGTTSVGFTIPMSVVVSHTTALAYSLQLASNSTLMKARATANTIGTTGATWWTAVKIG